MKFLDLIENTTIIFHACSQNMGHEDQDITYKYYSKLSNDAVGFVIIRIRWLKII